MASDFWYGNPVRIDGAGLSEEVCDDDEDVVVCDEQGGALDDLGLEMAAIEKIMDCRRDKLDTSDQDNLMEHPSQLYP